MENDVFDKKIELSEIEHLKLMEFRRNFLMKYSLIRPVFDMYVDSSDLYIIDSLMDSTEVVDILMLRAKLNQIWFDLISGNEISEKYPNVMEILNFILETF